MNDDFAIDRGLENGAFGLEFVAEGGGIDQVAIVADGQLTALAIDGQRLRIDQSARAGGGVAHVADGAIALEAFQVGSAKYRAHQPHVFMDDEGRTRLAGGGDTSAFLAAMLEGKQTVIGQNSCVGMTINGKYAAFVFKIGGAQSETKKK